MIIAESVPFKLGVPESGNLRHCKIVGTLGPASSTEVVLRKLVESGLNIVRLNFSHGDHATHLSTLDIIRKISRETGLKVGILQDLQGPKIRCGKLKGGKLTIETGSKYILRYGDVQTEDQIIPIDYAELVKDVSVGHRVMMDDGLLIFKVTDVVNSEVHVVCEDGGLLKNRKGVNFPDSILSLPALTEKDSRDLLFGIAQGVDFVALSFVQSAQDVKQVKDMIRALGADVPVIAKIEKLAAIADIDKIAEASDGLMVARGDLGVEARVEKVPSFQRRIIKAAAKQKKPVIIATQMLESMIHNPRATLAEITDVANGVLDGADCLMLSGEVAAGKYPVECVTKMSSIIEEVEAWTMQNKKTSNLDKVNFEEREWESHEAIAKAACEAADALKAKAIVCFTLTGNIAKTIAQWRPRTLIFAVSPRHDVIQQLVMTWGVYGIPNPLFYNTDELLQDVPRMLKAMNVVKSGETIVITAGIPINKMSPTNMIKINRIP